jgi:hypothetical protein
MAPIFQMNYQMLGGLGNDKSFVCGCTNFDYMSLGSKISCAHQCFQPCCGNNLGT